MRRVRTANRRYTTHMRTFLASALTLAIGSTILAAPQFQSDYSTQRAGLAADQLKRATQRLAERTLQDVLRSPGNTRAQLDEAVAAQQVDATASLIIELVRYRRPVEELRQVVTDLADLARRAPSYSAQSAYWRPVQDGVMALNRELGGLGPAPGRSNRPIIGRLEWRGWVDDRVHLVIRGASVEVRTISGTARPERGARFTSPLPNGAVSLEVAKTAGRGTVRVLQEPSRLNDFTAVIEIYDAPGGDDEYRLEVVWR